MTPGILMLIGAGALVFGILGVVLNFLLLAKRTASFDAGTFSFGFAMVVHIVCGLFYAGGFFTLLGGFIWFLVTVAKG